MILLRRFASLIIKRLVSNERALVINLLTDQPPANFEDNLLQVIRRLFPPISVRYSSFVCCCALCDYPSAAGFMMSVAFASNCNCGLVYLFTLLSASPQHGKLNANKLHS